MALRGLCQVLRQARSVQPSFRPEAFRLALRCCTVSTAACSAGCEAAGSAASAAPRPGWRASWLPCSACVSRTLGSVASWLTSCSVSTFIDSTTTTERPPITSWVFCRYQAITWASKVANQAS